MKPTVAVVTATTGRRELEQCVDSVRAQSFVPRHYIFSDGVPIPHHLCFGAIRIELPVKTGVGGMMNGGVLAASPFLTTEEYICWLDDDNWIDPNHIESLLQAIDGHDYAYSLRQIRTPDGKFFCNDDCESLGHHTGFIDANCFLMRRELAVKIAPLWYRTTGELMVGDRFVSAALMQMKVPGRCTGQYTLNYRLNNKRNLSAFFFEGNIRMRGKHPSGFPWNKTP